MLVNRQDVNAVQLGSWMTFKVCSNHNLALRTVDKLNVDEFALTGTYRGFYPFQKMSTTSESKIAESTIINKGYSETLPSKYYFINPDVPYIRDKFNNRIMFSEIHVNDSFKNSYRIFKGLDYKDYNVGWGSITKILEWQNNLMVVFEHGIGIIPINENAIAASGNSAGDVYIRGQGVLPATIKPISDTYGSQWKDSVIKSSRYVYGIDHVGKKIWRTNGEQIELISDFKIQSFLNENVTLSSREKTPTAGIRNIKTHYNAFKEDIMFTYYDVDNVFDEKRWNMCFNEQLSRWITRYDWEPIASENINNIYFSYDRESPEKLALLASSYIDAKESTGIVVTNYEILNPENFIEEGDSFDPSTQAILDIGLENKVLLKLKSDILEKYTPTFYINYTDEDISRYDNDLFDIITHYSGQFVQYEIVPKDISALLNINKYLFSIRIKAVLHKQDGTEWDSIYDTVHIRLNRTYYDDVIIDEFNHTQKDRYDIQYTTRFWKHGQAGIFDYAEEVKPTTWYGTTRPFEFEFILSDQPGLHKILDDLILISNNTAPESFTFTVSTDSYTQLQTPSEIASSLNTYTLDRRGNLISLSDADKTQITTITKDLVSLYQLGADTWKVGRLFGNMQYKENYWYVTVAPIQMLQMGSHLAKQSRIKDKQIKIRVKYDGKDLAVITQLNSLYTQTYS